MTNFPELTDFTVIPDQNTYTISFSGLQLQPIPDRYQIVVCLGNKLGRVLFTDFILAGAQHYTIRYPGLASQTQYIVAARAELSDGSHAGPWAEAVVTTSPPYVNPLSKVTGLVCERVDQGVDFAGSGPILAMGDGVVIETDGPGWPGGPFMSYRLTDGPAVGLVVYVAEDIEVLTLDVMPHHQSYMQTHKPQNGVPSIALYDGISAGTVVKAGQEIATMFNGDNGIEIGWARTDGLLPESQQPEAGSINGNNLPVGGTLIGRNMDQLLVSLGVPPANNLTLAPGGTLPKGYPSW